MEIVLLWSREKERENREMLCFFFTKLCFEFISRRKQRQMQFDTKNEFEITFRQNNLKGKEMKVKIFYLLRTSTLDFLC